MIYITTISDINAGEFVYVTTTGPKETGCIIYEYVTTN